MDDPIWILGIGMTPFGRFADLDIIDLAVGATEQALADAGVSVFDVQVLAAGCAFDSHMAGQRVLKQIGQTGIPVFNTVNACATGATAVRTAMLAIRAGEADVAVAVGMEKMGKVGLLGTSTSPDDDAFRPRSRFGSEMLLEGVLGTELMPGWFSMIGLEYADHHSGVGFEQFAKVAEKNHAHSTLNPLSQYRKRFSLDEVMGSEMMAYPNTVLMSSPTADGAAAVVLVSNERYRSLGLEQRRRAVKISASVMTSDPYTDGGLVQHDVNTLTRNAADQAYELAGVDPADLDLVELHDCFATAELVHYDNLRLCEPGGAGHFIDSGAPWRDGRTPVNVSGGLLSKGHPIGATGVANIYEVATHLRGEAGERQIAGAKVGMTHVLGGGWACVIHILESAAAC
jgi:acetyl-CoA acyltransferase